MPLTVSDHPRLRRRRTAALVATALAPAVLVLAFDHRGVHMARSLLLPGAGLYDEHPATGATLTVAAVLATVAWVRWGLDWLLGAVVVAAVALSGVVVDPAVHADEASAVQRSAHEFPLVVLVVGAITWTRAVARRLPGVARVARARAARRCGLDDLHRLPPVDRARAAALLGLTPVSDRLAAAEAAVSAPDVTRRCSAVDIWARARTGRRRSQNIVDHAPTRAALAAVLRRDAEALQALDALDRSARSTPWGVPCSEPGWVRPVDATLAAVVLHRAGRPESAAAWRRALGHEFGLRRGHRAGWCWAPLGIAAGAMPAWEHACVAALAVDAGWIDAADDWHAVRRAALGAAARPDRDAHDERLVAAARLLAHVAGDVDASRILRRATVRHDPLAAAIDAFAGDASRRFTSTTERSAIR